MLTPASLARMAGAELPAAASSWPQASGVNFHSGRLKAGDIFFALPGAAGHGMDHAAQALTGGAAFIVSDRPGERTLTVDDPAALLLDLGRHARTLITGTVTGVTGSAGKTTTKDMLSALLDAGSTPGNFNTTFALACTMTEHALHSPQKPLVLELGIDRPGEMAELVELVRPDAGIITSIGLSHAEHLGPEPEIAAQKRQLLEASRLRYAGDHCLPWLEPLPEGTVLYGLSEGAHVRGEASGSPDRPVLKAFGREWPVPLPGDAAATNLLGALLVARDQGVDDDTMLMHLGDVRMTGGRLHVVRAGSRTVLDDSYNSSPASLRAALQVLAGLPGPHSAVLGDMRELGSAAASAHEEAGRDTAALDAVIFAGHHREDFTRGNPRARTASDTAEALQLLDTLPPGGSVLVKASRSLGFEQVVRHLQDKE